MGRSVNIDIYIGDKKIRMTGIIVAALVLFIVACAAVLILKPGRGPYTVGGCRKLLVNERYIIHAGGIVDDGDGHELSYTNSREALANCYEKGNRISEFDFMLTCDEQVVCAHDDEEDDGMDLWAYNVKNAGFAGNPPSLESFINAKFGDSLSTMSLDDLAYFMKQHPDFYVVTDVKDDNEKICTLIREKYPELTNNFIIQIYHPDEYKAIKDIGFNYIIYTLYRAGEDELSADALTEFVNSSRLCGVTFWAVFPNQRTESFEALKECGVPLFVHTINDPKEMRSFIDLGISGIYTDVVNKEERI